MEPDLYTPELSALLFEENDDFVGIYDLLDERFVRINQAGARLLGFDSVPALLSDPVRSRSLRTQPLTADERLALYNRLDAGFYQETTLIGRQNGPAFLGRLSIRTYMAGERRFALVRLISQEQLHRTEVELEHSVRRYEAIFSSATIGIVVCDEQGHIVSANLMADQLFGYPAGGLLNQTIEQLVPTGVSRYHEKLRQSFNERPQVRAMGHNRDLHAQRLDGSVFPVEISLSYFRLEDELYVVAYIIDTTLKKEAERQLLAHRDHIERLNSDLEQKVADRTQALLNTLDQLEQSKDELARALVAERELGELKSRFVAMASHEFRTPLTAVLSSASLIEKYPGGDQQDKRQKHLDRIKSSVKHLNDILEEFLSVGRLEEGKVETRPVATDVARLLTDTSNDMQALLKPGQRIEPAFDCAMPVWLDPSLLRKMVVNLLSNALKYSGPDTVVGLSAACRDGYLTLTVQDQGIGISDEDQQHLFERFFRAKNATNVAGTGLGLHIVGRYVDLMRGQVSLHSELNKGTTVTIQLPYDNHSAD